MKLDAFCATALGALLLTGITTSPAFAVLPPFGSAEGKPDDPSTTVGCTVLRWRSGSYPYIPVSEPGKYCLDRDYTADLRGCIHGCSGKIIDIKANDVELDLRGHTLKINRYTGILAVGNNITIRNGRIRGGGVGVGVVYVAPSIPGLPTANAFSPSMFDIAYEQESPSVAVYGPGGARLENLVIETDDQPIDAAGANVTVIGSTIRSALGVDKLLARRNPNRPRQFIETSPLALLSIYGPGSVIEGNTFELTNRTGGRVPAHVILLRDAKGAVVRNNRIRNIGTKSKTVAIGLKDGPDVVTEGNTFVNIETPVAPFGSASAAADQPKR